MKKQLLAFFIIFSGLNLFAQAKFEKGYIINSQNEKTECFIKNMDWINIPSKLDYKLSEESNVEVVQTSDINAFQIYNTSQYYQKHSVLIDKNIDKKDFNPEKKEVFLKVLIEGSGSLFVSDSFIFFYQKKDGEVKQLVYKKYDNNNEKKQEDFSFRAELYRELKCYKNDAAKLRKVVYKEKQLKTFFTEYNQCAKTDYLDYSKKNTQWKFNVQALLAMNFNSSKSKVRFAVTDFDGPVKKSLEIHSSSTNVALGLDFEFLLPFNHNKWAIIMSPNYQQLNNNTSRTYYDKFRDLYTIYGAAPSQGGGNITIPIDFDFKLETQYSYSFIEIPVGLRHYFNLNKSSKIFIDASYGVIVNLKDPSETEKLTLLENNNNKPDLQIVSNTQSTLVSAYKFGCGYTFLDKYSIGLNYYLNRQIANTKVNSFSLVALYKIF